MEHRTLVQTTLRYLGLVFRVLSKANSLGNAGTSIFFQVMPGTYTVLDCAGMVQLQPYLLRRNLGMGIC